MLASSALPAYADAADETAADTAAEAAAETVGEEQSEADTGGETDSAAEETDAEPDADSAAEESSSAEDSGTDSAADSEAEAAEEDTASAAETESEAEPALTTPASTDSSEAEKPKSEYVKESYREFYDAFSGEKGADGEITLTAKDIVSSDDYKVHEGTNLTLTDIGGEKEVLNWANQEGGFDFSVDVPQSGVYSIKMSYYAPQESNTNDIEFELDINGECQYPTAGRVTLSKIWVSDPMGEIPMNSLGNDIRPGQEPYAAWQTSALKDIDGLSARPLLFHFDKGKNTVTLTSEKAQFAIKDITLYQYSLPGAYEKPTASEQNSVTHQRIALEGELADFKSARTLFPTNDMHSYITSAVNGSSPTKTRYNTIGKGSWNKSTQAATWNFTVNKDGWYKIGIRAKQDQMRGMYSNRRLLIDDEVPNIRSEQIKFYYDTDWNVVVPSESDDEAATPLYYHLTAGTHTLTLEAVPGEIGQIMGELDDLTSDINSYYRRIRQITGPDPDEYNNYMIDKTIPTIVDDFNSYSKQLRDLKSRIESLSNQGGSEAVTLDKMAIVLDECTEKPDRIPEMMSQIKDNVTSLSAWVSTYREQPLEVDLIEICSPDQEFTDCESHFFKSLKFGFDAFIGSFFEDYNSLSNTGDGENVMTCWIALGRDNATVVTNLVNNEYNLTADTKVQMKLVQGGIIEATFAGKGPDIALFMGGDFPIQLASRGVLVDVSQYPDFEEVSKRFSADATTLYKYNGGVYGLPVSQNFPMLFYRTDVLNELGVDPEKDLTTWEGLMNVLPVLQRSYMEVGLILPVMGGSSGITAVSPVTEAGNTFAMLLLQQGVNYYTDDFSKTNFDRQEAVNAFEQWTEFYTKYSFSQTYDALTRFRQGDMPVLIQDYSFFNTLTVTAPEIKGCWNFMHVPGTPNENGQVTLDDGTKINITSSSGGAGALIFKECPDVDGAWDFIKWFTSDEIQQTYGHDIESVLGTMGRYNTANINALQNLSWTQTQVNKLTEQLNAQVEVPVIPASYGVTRNLNNAFRETVNQYQNARDTLFWYDKDINEEITRKNSDLALYDN